MPIDGKLVVADIDSSLKHCKDVQDGKGGNIANEDWSELITFCAATIERWAPPGSQYLKQMQVALANKHERYSGSPLFMRVSDLRGILRALRDDYDAGRMQGMRELLHSQMFSDFLEMAEYLLNDEGYKDPAAVLAGGVLEQHLRKLCAKYTVPVPAKPKLDALNSELAKVNAYGKNEQKQVTAWAAIRNNAAHAEYNKYTPEEVRLMIQWVRHFISSYPA